jgi:hypothetical protein
MKTLLIATLATLSLAAVGCAADPGSSEETGGSSDEALSGGTSVPNPSGAYFASINANGTGCPAGTWDATISPDGQEFAVEFSQYEAELNPGQTMVVKDCTLGIDFHSPTGMQFAVSSFRYQGYAMLDEAGMTARQTAKYYFMGMPVPSRLNYTDFAGPRDDSYLFEDNILTSDLTWSPCGTTRRLNAQTRLIVQNNAQKSGSAYVNVSVVDDIKLVFRWDLSWRSC